MLTHVLHILTCSHDRNRRYTLICICDETVGVVLRLIVAYVKAILRTRASQLIASFAIDCLFLFSYYVR